MARRLRRYNILRVVLLIGLIAAITVAMQRWVGDATLYRPEHDDRRLRMHRYVLANRLPPGATWSSLGANGANTRVVAVYAAEAIHRTLGMPVLRAYFLIDSLALLASLLLLFALLRRQAGGAYGLIGLLYVCAVLPLTYVLHYYHPWDRLSLLLWVACAYLLREHKLLPLAVLLVVAVATKFDIVLLPGLYFLAHATRERFRPVALRTALLFALAFGTFFFLRWLRPGGFEPRSPRQIVARNVEDLLASNVAYPPLLAFAVPLLLAALGFRSADRFARASAAILVLLLPAALAGVRELLSPAGASPPHGGADDASAGATPVASSPAR